MVKGEGNVERRASPLYVRIFRAGQNYYVGVQIFKSRFLPCDLELEDLNKSSNKAIVAAPTYKALDDFISGLENAIELRPWDK